MKVYSKLRFLAWKNYGEEDAETAYALVNGQGYFQCAINCLRDGDMGEKDENGIYDREWWGDSIWPEEKYTVRPMTLEEVHKYMSYVNLNEEYSEDIIVILGEESYALIGGKDGIQ